MESDDRYLRCGQRTRRRSPAVAAVNAPRRADAGCVDVNQIVFLAGPFQVARLLLTHGCGVCEGVPGTGDGCSKGTGTVGGRGLGQSCGGVQRRREGRRIDLHVSHPTLEPADRILEHVPYALRASAHVCDTMRANDSITVGTNLYEYECQN
eukprot:6200358-Pleurochrysis_carterae.AAC.3